MVPIRLRSPQVGIRGVANHADDVSTRRYIAAALVVGLVLPPAAALAAKDRAPGFYEQSLDLPGMPAAVIPADMNGDGRDDLVVLVAYTGWGELATTERVEFDDIEGLVEVMSVVSSLVDRRELRVYLTSDRGMGFESEYAALELDTSVHALAAGDSSEPLLAITDEGVAAVRWEGESGSPGLVLVPLFEVETSLTGTGAFYSEFEFLHDLDADGRVDLLLPTAQGWSIFGSSPEGFDPSPSSTLEVPPRPAHYWDEDHDYEEGEEGNRRQEAPPEEAESKTEERREKHDKEIRIEPDDQPARLPRPQQPQIEDVNGDGRLDLIVFKVDRGRDPLVYLNRGRLVFEPSIEVGSAEERDDEEIVYIGDLDGAGLVSVVSAEELEPGDEAGFKMEIEHAKEPDFQYRVYPLAADLTMKTSPRQMFEAEGYTFEGEDDAEEEDGDDIEIKLPGGFKDLDGDGRQDLVAITLDFSLVPLIFRALVLGSVSMRMDFHPHCQNEDGGFERVPGLDLSGKFKINLRNVQVKHLSQFEGDFNGDGRADFIQLGRGKKVTISTLR